MFEHVQRKSGRLLRRHTRASSATHGWLRSSKRQPFPSAAEEGSAEREKPVCACDVWLVKVGLGVVRGIA